MAGDVTDAWGGCGGLVGQLNHMENVIDMSTADRPGIAVTYDCRIHALIQQGALKRSSITDYFDLLRNVNADVKGAAVRGFETRAGLAKKAKEKKKAGIEKEKAQKNKDWEFKGWGIRISSRKRPR